jgi:transcription-repair coupling factor (superfamily II helicase)
MRAQFVSDNEEYFKSAIFGKILAFVQQHARSTHMKDTTGKLNLTIENVASVDEALRILDQLI